MMKRIRAIPRSPSAGYWKRTAPAQMVKQTITLDPSDPQLIAGFGGTEAELRAALAMVTADAAAAGMDVIAFLDLMVSDERVLQHIAGEAR